MPIPPLFAREFHDRPSSVRAQFLNPFLQDGLIRWLNLREGNPHSAIRRVVRDLAESGEVGALVRNSNSYLRSWWEGFECHHTATVQTQVAGPLLDLRF